MTDVFLFAIVATDLLVYEIVKNMMYGVIPLFGIRSAEYNE